MISSGDSRLQDGQALAEIELYGELVIAASSSAVPLRPEQIDRVLGLLPHTERDRRGA